ncbi:acetate--CoA ligase family protein [Halalkalibacter krulwichiae]|uniref:Succinyl-CoA synthetase subunit alpha n=1 Tax=Halalkalibacter krulwichiae TaxID=199441 RepID=A0A1X9MBK7_9BACI|nr:acetate--CoA ligase family protein [Halalkalibacter krulwichiae]ARK29980.1 succinyl-CoA synthetase subunit alpha [Halalkalibacter krulwichiae]
MGRNNIEEPTVVTEKGSNGFLMEYEGAEILCEYGLPVAKSKLARTEEEAIELANTIGYPIVLKGMSRDIVHKTEAGIVKVNITNQTQLIKSFNEVLTNASNYNSEAKMAGVLVQEMASKGIELIIGIKKDPIFGHQLVIGFGGTLVEIMKDFSMRMMPVSKEDIAEMIKELKSYPIIEGYRGQQGINKQKLIDICLGLNNLVAERPEIEELDLNPIMFSGNEAAICDVRILVGNDQKNEVSNRDLTNVKYMLNPRSIAVIGASTNEKKNGGRLFRYIVENNFDGELYPINPGATEIKGYKAYPSLKEVPGEIDLACIIVGAKHVPQVMEECIAKGIKAAIVYSSGFAEIGEEGQALQERLLSLAEEGNIRVLGPNSIGIASPSKNIYTAFGAALESKVKVPGNIGFISQSGAMGSALLSRAWEQGAGFSRWVSVANEADLTIPDFIEVLAEDELTNVITVFMEGIKDAKAFKKATEKAFQQKKPVLVFKTGRSSVGKRAVQSHTGSIAGDDAVFSAAFKKYGALRIDHIEELIDVSRAFNIQRLPKGNRVGVLTASGGACSVIADLCSEKGLEVPELKESINEIKELIPSFGSAQNPVDVTAEVIAKPEMFKKVMETLTRDSNIDGVIVMLTTNADPGATVIAQAILDVFNESDKPIVVGRLGAEAIATQAMDFYQKNAFPVYSTPEKVVNVMDYLVRYSKISQEKK